MPSTVTLQQIELIDIDKRFRTKTAEYFFFSKCTWNIPQDKSHIRPQKKLKKRLHLLGEINELINCSYD